MQGGGGGESDGDGNAVDLSAGSDRRLRGLFCASHRGPGIAEPRVVVIRLDRFRAGVRPVERKG